MVTEGTLALLSACSAILKGSDLAIARDQIRMTLGCLKVLGEVWPRTARNVREIQVIAQCVLGLEYVANNGNAFGPSDVPSLNTEGTDWGLNTSDIPNTNIDMSAIIGTIDDLCGWYNLENPDELPWGMSYGL